MFKFALKKKMVEFRSRLSEPMWALIVHGAAKEKVDELKYIERALDVYSVLRAELAVNKDMHIAIVDARGFVKKYIFLPV